MGTWDMCNYCRRAVKSHEEKASWVGGAKHAQKSIQVHPTNSSGTTCLLRCCFVFQQVFTSPKCYTMIFGFLKKSKWEDGGVERWLSL